MSESKLQPIRLRSEACCRTNSQTNHGVSESKVKSFPLLPAFPTCVLLRHIHTKAAVQPRAMQSDEHLQRLHKSRNDSEEARVHPS